MKQYRQKEVAKFEGVEPRTIQRWGEEELEAKGWRREEYGGKVWYMRDQEGEAEAIGETRSDLEMRKLRAEIAEKEQKLDKRKKQMFQEWSDLYTEMLMESFADMNKMLAESRFDEVNSTKWNEVIDTCTNKLAESSKDIYRLVDINDL